MIHSLTVAIMHLFVKLQNYISFKTINICGEYVNDWPSEWLIKRDNVTQRVFSPKLL